MATRTASTATVVRLRAAALAAAVVAIGPLAGCASTPLEPYATATPPLVLVPAAQAGVRDQRARFREIYCAVLAARAATVPDHRPCEEALTRVGDEPAGAGRPVNLGNSRRRLILGAVPGIGYDCVAPWLQAQGTVVQHAAAYGYDVRLLAVDALSGSARNARLIRDAVLALPQENAPRIVLVGYSKGAPDILEAVVAYPEIRSRIAAVVSVAGAIGGSPLANDATQNQAELMRHFPGAKCDAGDGGGVDSLRPATRRAWLAQNPLPRELRYYSLVTFPKPERISLILKRSYNRLAEIDARNDSQVIFYDQVVPGSTLLGYLDADHWAVALPINRTHPTLAETLVTQNAYPREALVEALLRFVEEDLGAMP